MKNKSFLLLTVLLLLGFGLLEVVRVVALLLLQEGYHRHGFFNPYATPKGFAPVFGTIAY
jgi:hypothetical protein